MKIMVWNIEKFTQAKFEDHEYYPTANLGRKRKRQYNAGYDRVFYMRRVVNAWGSAADRPDVIAIVETMINRDTALGRPMNQLDSSGVLQFLTLIKAATGNNAWRVVPPIKCNPPKPALHVGKWAAQEAVAVFYNTHTVTFAGPDHWTAAGIQRPGGGGAPVAYPNPWHTGTITGATTRAGRVAHTDTAGNEVLFPAAMNRRPFMVDFREVGGAARLFRCLFIHTSPAHGPAGTHVTGTTAVADIADMDPAHNTTAAPDYYVACGDFNVNDYWMHETNAAYPPLTALNYRRMLRTANTDSTHYLRDHEADPLNAPFSYQQVQIIDNFFVLRHPGPQPGLATYTKVSIDSVEGAPAPWDSVMGQDLNTINAIGPGIYPGPTATFRQWANFWSIVSTSDHLPIYLRIP